MTAPDRPTPEVRDEWVEQWCEVMHDAYEKAAGESGWLTQERSRVPWADVPEANKATMRLAVRALVPLIEADVGERIATALYRRVDEWERCIPVFGPVDGTGRPDPKGQMMVDVSREGLMADLRIEIARAVATGDEGGQ